ncbi:MAG TPA: helix-turn-helix transcriptional regulator, partial [Cryptosporangiaceae bacterium]|nr:helix-turn-helix transcriptional regulator [Cryptosporangiaceae bacterium]
MVLLRRVLGDALREQRLTQQRTLREVSTAAMVSLGYLSEVERGQKEASSELLSSICDALGVRLSEVLRDVSDTLQTAEAPAAGVLEAVPGTAVPEQPRDLEVVAAGFRGDRGTGRIDGGRA